MLIENVLIHELAERARSTVRTIRYYTDEGLLPPPVIKGKYAYYTLNHLNRLELIRRLKDSYLPLREIRKIMNSLSDGEVQQRLQEQILSTPKTDLELNPGQPAQGAGAKALEYIARLMDEQSAHRPPGTASPAQALPPVNKGEPIPIIANPPAAPNSLPEGETWQRIPLAAGVELIWRQPTDPDTTSRIQQLIAFAQKMFPN